MLLSLAVLSFSCANAQPKANGQENKKAEVKSTKDTSNKMAKAYFASGCFWCVEAIYESIEGVGEVVNGYAGGHTKNPTYEESNTGETGHAEAV
ncbi:MAG: peptide-methionine (S)-S-oxide reductase, partial [Bacteroidetes bacterium]|nr:peptide-methionine (S)-S-oxide reductase [Bacteroidota bacterium]